MIDLDAEFVRAMTVFRRPDVLPKFEWLGLSLKIGWGLAPVEFYGPNDRYYQPKSPDGVFAVIAPVVQDGDLIDLCAIRLPDRHVGTRLGQGKALGLDVIDRCRWDCRELQLVEDPLRWLPDCSAFVIDWWAADFTLADLKTINCASRDLAERVEKAFRVSARLPELSVTL